MLQGAIVALIVLACAAHVVWALLLPASWQQRVQGRLRPSRHRAAPAHARESACGRCQGCAPPPAKGANEPTVVRVLARR